MAADDKLRLKIAAKRIEAWDRYRQSPPKDVKRCTSVMFAPGQDKPSLVYLDKDTIVSGGDKMRSSSGKFARELRLDGGDKCHGDGDGYDPLAQANTPKHMQGLPKVAKARKNSPFKAAKKAPIIVRKQA